MKRIVFLGPSGCGKGTQSKILVDNYEYVQLSTGDLLRNEVQKENSKYGNEIKELMQIGELVPDTIVISLIIERISELNNSNIIFDGFPRNINQAEVLDDALKKISVSLDNAILIDVEFAILEERIKKRISESKTNEQRTDDNLETLLNRIEIYKNLTLPIVNYYEKHSILNKVDGMNSVENVNQEILKIIS